MSNSHTTTNTTTFTATHARHISAKVATDLKRMQRFYGFPSDGEITEYEEELMILMKNECLGIITYGFRRDGKWIEPTVRYTARDLQGLSASSHDPGGISPDANVNNAKFGSYLTYSSVFWNDMTPEQREDLKNQIPVKRSYASEPGVDGDLVSDKTYSAGGVALDRFSVRSWQ